MIDWKLFLLGEEQWSFLLETLLRTFVMFTIILLCLRFLGKRGIKQLSVFELGVIIGLGSAAGDPMFYKDVGVVPAIVVFIVIVVLYRLITFLINRSDRFEKFVEGRPTTVVRKGILLFRDFEHEPIAREELFAAFRLRSISHLGQVQQAIVESNGEISVFYLPDEAVQWGLPIVPGYCEDVVQQIMVKGFYSCNLCGFTSELPPAAAHTCPECGHKKWVLSMNAQRVK